MTRIRALAIAAVLAGAAAPASANVWKHASDPIGATADEVYARALATGDDLALQASAQSTISLRTIKSDIQLALTAYRAAAAAEPERAEPYFRIGDMLYSFFFELCSDPKAGPSLTCDANANSYNRAIAQQIIDAWNAAEARAPDDPRFGYTHSSAITTLFERGVLNTKFNDTEHLEAAGRDYRKLIARWDGAGDESGTINNLAETYMMLGKLDDAVETYRDAVRRGGDVTTVYGLAVALDRAGSGDEARTLIARLGKNSYDEFREYVRRGITFYVPTGEVYYYLALTEEAVGDPADAIEYWNQYLKSGAHPQFQPRARANRDALLAGRKKLPPPPNVLDLGM